MKQKSKKIVGLMGGAALVVGLVFGSVSMPGGSALAWQNTTTQNNLSNTEAQAVAAFEKRVREYVQLREQLEEKMPKLSKEATPEQIEAHTTALKNAVQAARANAKAGDLFTPGVAAFIRKTIRNEFKGKDRVELRETILEADTKGVPMKVNFPYPEAKELAQIPPTLLLKLPQLPKQVKYRFVGRNMLLVDRENSLIIDYLPKALP